MASYSTFESRDGYDMLMCTRHHHEECKKCNVDFTKQNKESQELFLMKKAEKNPMKPGLLPKGSMVRVQDRSGETHLGIIRGCMVAVGGDPRKPREKVLSYIISDDDESDGRMTASVSLVHGDFTLEGITFDTVKEIVMRQIVLCVNEPGGCQKSKDDDSESDGD